MIKARSIFTMVAISAALAVLSGAAALAQDSQVGAPIKISLTAAKTTVGPDEAVKLQIRVYNASTSDVITREGFFDQNFYTVITFTDPDGLPVRNTYKAETDEPGPPDFFGGRAAFEIETIPPLDYPLSDGTLVGERVIVLDDAREFYILNKYGWYTAQILVPMETFSEYVEDERGVFYSFLDDPGRKGYNPVASNRVRFEILSPEPVETGAIHVNVSHLKIGQETRPKTTKTPMELVTVRLIPEGDLPEDHYPINWKTYSEIWAWTNGAGAGIAVTRYTDNQGVAKFDAIGQDDYLVLAYYNASQDFKHMGSLVTADDPDWLTEQPIEKHLMVMEKANGKKVPGKTIRLKGSDLLITEPEFVLWDSDQEQYPFVFESVGEWGVTTSVAPPEGFVADHDQLDAEVVNAVETVQFTISEVGSRWEETQVIYRVRHGKRMEIIRNNIGIKLARELASEKALGIYGHTPEPGPFKGGKLVKVEDKGPDKGKGKKK